MSKQQGNIVTVVLLVAILVSVIGVGGYYVYNQNKKDDKVAETNSATSTTTSADKKASEVVPESKDTQYTFAEFGIKMTILDGWKVENTNSKDDYGDIYHWEVTKPGADGKIVVDSRGFLGGWGPDCSFESGVAQINVDIKDVVATKKENLILLSRVETYTGSTDTGVYTVIAEGKDTIYAPFKSPESAEIPNSDLKPGTTYYRCTSGPNPGMFLGLTQAKTQDSARNDVIHAVKVGSDAQLGYSTDLSTTASSYADIKKMLASIE